jgi:hypothetical protein
MSQLSTVTLVDTYEKVKAQGDADQDVHYKRTESSGSTLCGMKPTDSSGADVTCYRCIDFALGNF